MEKRKNMRFATGMLAAVLLFGTSGQTWAREEADIGWIAMPTGDMAERELSKPMEMLSSSDTENLNKKMAEYMQDGQTLLRNKNTEFYYYVNLDPVAKEIYDVMYQVAQDPVNEGNIGLMMTDMDPQTSEFYYEFNMAYRALCFDHPELFWLYSGEEAQMEYASEAVMQNGFYFVYIMMSEPFAKFATQMTQFNQAVDSFLADIDTGISEYDTIRQVHDKLLDLVNYNDPVAETEHIGPGQDLAHTAYGALVADSAGNPNYAVCDGYTLAFEYLLQQCGIETVFIGGKAGATEEDAGGHAWNIVKMDGTWYEVDTTWDDSESMVDNLDPESADYYYVTEALANEEYREKIDHYLFLVSTEHIRNFVSSEEYDYLTNDQEYVYRLVQDSVHIRLEDDGTDTSCDNAIISLAPIAMQSYR